MEQSSLAPITELLMQYIEKAIVEFRETGNPYYLDTIHYCAFKARDRQGISSLTDKKDIQLALHLISNSDKP